MSTTIESLELEVLSSSQSAESGLDALTASLEKLKKATSGGVGLTSVIKQIKGLGDAAKSVDSTSINNLSGLTKAISTLSNLGGVKLSSTIATQITAIGDSAKTLNGVNFAPISDLANSLSPLSTIGKINLNSVVNQLNRIPELATQLNSSDMSGFASKIRELVTALQPLSEMPKQTISSTLTQIKKIPEIFAGLNGVDMGAFSAKIQELATALKPLADEMNKVAAGFSAFPAKIQRLIANTNSLTASNNKASNSYINLYAKIRMAVTAVKTIASKIASAISLSSGYIETVNLFTVSMGKYAEQAKAYAETVSEAMGIDPAEWMKNQGVFMTLTKGFGVAGDRANTMSQQLTQLGYDLASFFNLEGGVSDAMQKLQSGISGELEPLRRLGYDLSQARLEAVALSLGIDKAVSSMTQAEKAELRYYAIMTQVTDAQGDMARTLNAPANQLRILTAQVTQLGRALGDFFIPLLNKVLPPIIAAVKVLREVMSVFMSLLGIELSSVDWGSDSITSATEDVTSNLDDATDSAKKLKSYLMGFDELNVINPNEDSGELEEMLGTGFDFELPTYDFMDNLVATRIDEIVQKMKDWLGLTDDVDTWAELMDTRLGNILKTVGLIGAGILAWKVTKSFIDSIVLLKTLLSTPSYAITIAATVAIVGFTLAFTGMDDAVTNGLDGFNFGEIVAGGLLSSGASAVLGSKLATWITTTFAGSKVATALTTAAANLGVGTAGAAGAALAAGVAGIIVGIPAMIVGIYDAIKEKLNWLNGSLIGLGATAAGAGIGAIIGACGGPIGGGIGALIGLAVGLITDFTIWLWQNFESVEEWFNGLPGWAKVAVGAFASVGTGGIFPLITGIITLIKKWDDIVAAVKNFPDAVAEFFADIPNKISGAFKSIDEWVTNFPSNVRKKLDEIGQELDALPAKIKKWFSNTTKNIKKWFSDLWKPIKEFDWNGLGQDIGQWFGNAVKDAYVFVTKTVPEWFADLGTSIKNGFATFFTSTLPQFFTQTIPQVVQDVADFFKTLPERITNVVKSVGSGIVDVGKAILDGIFEGLCSIGDAIKRFVSGFVQGFKDAFGIHSPSTVFAEIGGYLTDGLFEGLLAKLGDIGEWVRVHIIEPFNAAIDGALNFGIQIVNDAQSWWSNVKSWWSGVVDNTIAPFVVEVKNKASSWWSNVQTWWSGVVGNVKEFGTSVANTASTWWSNTKVWWNNVVGNVSNFATNVANDAQSWWSNVKSWWSGKVGAVANFTTSVTNSATTWWNNVKSWWSGKVGSVANFTTNVTNNASTWWSNVKSWWSSASSGGASLKIKAEKGSGWSQVSSWVDALAGTLKIKLPHISVSWIDTGVLGIKYPSFSVSYYAKGGFPDMGQLFIAREAGAELVGNIGGRTAVMNNDQIVESVSAGVYQAVIAALGGNGDEGGDTQIIINLDGEKIYENQQKVARNRGYNLGMGVFSFG